MPRWTPRANAEYLHAIGMVWMAGGIALSFGGGLSMLGGALAFFVGAALFLWWSSRYVTTIRETDPETAKAMTPKVAKPWHLACGLLFVIPMTAWGVWSVATWREPQAGPLAFAAALSIYMVREWRRMRRGNRQ